MYAKPSHVEQAAKQVADLLGLENVEDITMWRHWLREIYADMFALAVGGPGYISSLVTFYYPLLVKQPVQEDTQHPPFLLRLYIDLHAARKLYEIDSRNLYTVRTVERLAQTHSGTRKLAGYHTAQLSALAQQVIPSLVEPVLDTNLGKNRLPSIELVHGELANEYRLLREVIIAWNSQLQPTEP